MSVTDVILLSFLVTNFVLSSICLTVLYLHKKYGTNGLFKTKIVVHRHVYEEAPTTAAAPDEHTYVEDIEINDEK